MKLRKSKYLIFTVLSFFAFTACEETVILDVDFESRLVINSFFDSDSPWAVEVSTSENIIDPNSHIELLENARVTIYDHNNIELYELYHIENGVYGREGYYPSPTKVYKIKVEAGAKVVTAESYVPEQSKLQINNFEVVMKDKDEGVEVDFQIEDKSDIEAYYIWEIVSLEDVEVGDDGVSSGKKLSDALIDNIENSSISSQIEKIEILGRGAFGNGTYSTVYNTLEGRQSGGRFNPNVNGVFNAKDVTNDTDDIEVSDSDEDIDIIIDDYDDLVFSFDPNGDDDDPIVIENETEDEEKFELRVVSISKELYLYYQSVENSKGLSNTSDSEQYPLYTNVDKGLGIFAGFSESIIRF